MVVKFLSNQYVVPLKIPSSIKNKNCRIRLRIDFIEFDIHFLYICLQTAMLTLMRTTFVMTCHDEHFCFIFLLYPVLYFFFIRNLRGVPFSNRITFNVQRSKNENE